MNPLYVVIEWADSIIASLGCRKQIEVSDTPSEHIIHVAVGGVAFRREILELRRSSLAWYPVTIGGVKYKSESKLRSALSAMRSGIVESVKQEMPGGKATGRQARRQNHRGT